MALMHPLVECVAGFLAERNTPADAHLFVGCSGGPDSVALAHMIAALYRDGVIARPTLVYVDHQLRADSAGDGELVQRLADQLGLAAVIERVQVERERASLEDAARIARYAAFERLADDRGAAAVLLAHTQTDQAETVIMRLLRGTGVVGLAAIPRVRDRYWRPLLGCTRGQIEAYCGEHQLEVARDAMNDDKRFLRVRVRADVMPLLERENPAIDQALARLAAAASEHKQVWDYAAEALLQLAADEDGFSVRVLAEAPAGVTKRAVSLASAAAGGELLEARHQNALVELIARPDAGTVTVDLPGICVVREYGRLRFASTEVQPSATQVTVEGSRGPYVVRTWRAGDRMRPTRLKGRSRKLSDLYVDAKVPRLQRARAVVVTRESDGEIVWAEFVGHSFDCDAEVALTTPRTMATNND